MLRIAEMFRLKLSLSKLQTVVGLTAGILSILLSVAAFLKPASSDKAEIVAIVQDGKTEKAVTDATIEILTPEDALITTLKPDWRGKARWKADEGRYRLRVSHPRYRSEVRDVQVISKESTEVRVELKGSGDPLSNAVHKLFHR
jgi:hypothetical protein